MISNYAKVIKSIPHIYRLNLLIAESLVQIHAGTFSR